LLHGRTAAEIRDMGFSPARVIALSMGQPARVIALSMGQPARVIALSMGRVVRPSFYVIPVGLVVSGESSLRPFID
jgi:hypothetical protein